MNPLTALKKPYTILFDLDDTLIDFQGSERKSLKLCHERHFDPRIPYETFLSDYKRINRHLWNEVEKGDLSTQAVRSKRFQQLAELYQMAFKSEIMAGFEQDLVHHCTWVDGAVPLLEELKAANFKIGFVTNGVAHMQRNKYTNLQLSRFSKTLVISDEVGFAKPHPSIFQHALDLLKTDPRDALMVGDSLTSDGEGARKLGMTFCWYNPHQSPNPLSWQPDLIVHHLTALRISLVELG
jgi:2-haloacid dehalogenase